MDYYHLELTKKAMRVKGEKLEVKSLSISNLKCLPDWSGGLNVKPARLIHSGESTS